MPLIIDNKEEINFFTPFLSKSSKIKVLDIGCGEGLFLSNIYNFMPTKISKLIGVDSNEKKEHDLDKDVFLKIHNSFVENSQLHEDQIELIETDGFSFLKGLKTNQDLIVFLNFLHLYPWDKSKILIQNALKKLSFDGIIYIKVRHKPLNEGESYPFDSDTINEIKSFCKILNSVTKDKHYYLVIKKVDR